MTIPKDQRDKPEDIKIIFPKLTTKCTPPNDKNAITKAVASPNDEPNKRKRKMLEESKENQEKQRMRMREPYNLIDKRLEIRQAKEFAQGTIGVAMEMMKILEKMDTGL